MFKTRASTASTFKHEVNQPSNISGQAKVICKVCGLLTIQKYAVRYVWRVSCLSLKVGESISCGTFGLVPCLYSGALMVGKQRETCSTVGFHSDSPLMRPSTKGFCALLLVWYCYRCGEIMVHVLYTHKHVHYIRK